MVFTEKISHFWSRIYNNSRSLLAFIFIFSVICSLIFLSFFRNIGPSEHQVPASDYIYLYEPVANNILEGKGITLEGKVPFVAGLGYPVILSGIFWLSHVIGVGRLDLIVVFNVLFAGLAGVFFYLLVNEIFKKRIAVIASFLWLTYPFFLWLLKNPNTEMPFLPLLFAGLWLYVTALKRKSFKFFFLAGLILGLASSVRLMAIFLPLFLAGLGLFLLMADSKKRKLLLIALLLTGNLVAILPWAAYSFLESGSFLFLSKQGPKNISTGITWLITPGASNVLSPDLTALAERAKNADLSSFPKLIGFFINELKNSPLTLLELVGLKLARSWYATSTRWYEMSILAVQFLYLASGLAGLVWLIKNQKDKIREIISAAPAAETNLFIFILAVIFYFWSITFVTVSIMRYMLPAMAMMIIFSAIAINIVINKLWRLSSQ